MGKKSVLRMLKVPCLLHLGAVQIAGSALDSIPVLPREKTVSLEKIIS